MLSDTEDCDSAEFCGRSNGFFFLISLNPTFSIAMTSIVLQRPLSIEKKASLW